MEKVSELQQSGQQLVYFAAERTLLAWMRTALGVMALGFVIDRFGVALKSPAAEMKTAMPTAQMPFWLGTVLVLLGVLMILVAIVRYWRFSKQYHSTGTTEPGHGLLLVIGFSFVVAVAGIMIAMMLLQIAQ